MRIAVMGTGAVGGYFGAKLAAAGHELVFIARGKQLEAMQRDGLQVKSADANLHIRNALFTDAASAAGNVELVLFCVKSYDTDAASTAIAPLMGPRTIILSLQNGIDNSNKLAARWGAMPIFAGVVYVGAAIERPGVVVHSSGGRIVFGCLDGTINDNAKSVAQSLATALIPHEVSAEIAKVQWTKVLWNASFCAISSLTRANVKQIVHSEPLTKLVRDCMAEVRTAALTRGIDLPTLALDQTIEFSRTLGDFKPSMLQDLEAGKPLEHEAFNGVVVKILRQAGKTAPTNEAFYAMLDYID
ncbi:MAG: ketopantoate reductase family protein, partial [Candidatus Binatia bacterium]